MFNKSLNTIYKKQLLNQFNKFNFSSSEQFDLVVIGGGPGGYVAAIKAGQLGLKVACVEKRGTLGGTCLNVGCIPSKALLNISHKYYDSQKHFDELGLDGKSVSFDWSKIQKKKDGIVGSLTKGIEGLFAKNKVKYYKGLGSFVDANTIQVDGLDGNKLQINAKNTIIATGSEPSSFPGIPYDEKVIVSSTGALSLQKVPENLVVVGGGVIGLEMGSVYARLGSQVTVVEFQDRIIPGPTSDVEVSKAFQKILTKQGLKFLTSTKVVSAQNNGNSVDYVVESVVNAGQQQSLKADVMLISTGRRAYTAGLNLEKVGLSTDKFGRVDINDHFQTQVPNIYAIGDVVRGAMLAHKAEEEGIACVEMLAGHGKPHINYLTIPGVIYTHPEVATVGYTEEQLKEKGIKYRKGSFPFLANSRAKAVNDTDGFVKILTDAETDRILGIHMISQNAGEAIAEGVLGMEYGAASEDIARTCHAHPTLSEAFKEACMAAYDKPIHF